jgi:hypothetical protein
LSFWEKDQPKPKQAPHALPVFSVHTSDEAQTLILLVGKRAYNLDGYLLSYDLHPRAETGYDIDDLDEITEKIADIYQQFVVRH